MGKGVFYNIVFIKKSFRRISGDITAFHIIEPTIYSLLNMPRSSSSELRELRCIFNRLTMQACDIVIISIGLTIYFISSSCSVLIMLDLAMRLYGSM